ncbi:hypothetical protein D1007_04662 [Hordeum vulgare]|nr:hypothetical protein D1007_04662 [Hordeum vulgare]
METGSSSKNLMMVVSAADFHPHNLLDEVHEEFVDEIKDKNAEEISWDMVTGGEKEMEMEMESPKNNMMMDMSAHLDYCSEQLQKIEMLESDEEEEGVLPEMQCLPKEMTTILGSTKRSLLDTLEKEAGLKEKKNSNKEEKWGPVLNNKPNTRGHGGVKIMDKVLAYMLKKNLEMPMTFKGKTFATLSPRNLIADINKVDICIGKHEDDQSDIILEMMNEERFKSMQFAESNIEIVLP